MAAKNSRAVNQTGNYTPMNRSYAASLHVEPLADGIDGTFQTLAAMRSAVLGQIPPDYSGYQDPYNAQAAASIARGSASDVAALLRYVRDSILYVDHPWNMQVVKDCKRTLESKTGDCVSKSVCLATLLAARGISSQFVAQAPNGEDHDHVYVQAFVNGQWLSLDPTADGRDGRPFGEIGWSQKLPDGGIETPYSIFF
jgi:transglutaminase-like putative cysteine protease